MKIILPILLTILIWVGLFKVFFTDAEDFWETAKENSFWFAVGIILDTHLGGIKFLIFVCIGVLAGALLYNLL